MIHSSNFIVKVTGRYFIPTLEDYLLEFNLNEYDCLTQNNRDRCEMVGCHYTQFLNIFNTDMDDINKNDVGYSYSKISTINTLSSTFGMVCGLAIVSMVPSYIIRSLVIMPLITILNIYCIRKATMLTQ